MAKSPGALDDPRSPEAKAKDYQAEEVASFAPVTWVEKKPSVLRKFEIFDQDGSSSCVAQATAKLLGIENFVEEGVFHRLSARDVYTRRKNKPGEGMWFQDALDIASKHGATLESLMPSDKRKEKDMNVDSDRTKSAAQIGLVFKAGGYVQLPLDIEKIASVIASGKAVLLGFRFWRDEWKTFPKVIKDKPPLHHGVAGVDHTLYKGEKCTVIHDSWGLDAALQGQRFINQAWLTARCSFAGYLLDLSNNWRDGVAPTKPIHVFTTDLVFGSESSEVQALQDVLKHEQVFPQDVPSTGKYGNVTAKAVLAFQKKHKVAPEEELDLLAGKRVGIKTREKLNELYGK